VRLSKQLGLGVIAEGIETDPQLAAARRAGCDAVQGYHIAPPLRAARLEGFCLDWSGVAAGS
jgi:EAL domain-containing protein (putative c-di-GMP-specific phosphodiesterase class I)